MIKASEKNTILQQLSKWADEKKGLDYKELSQEVDKANAYFDKMKTISEDALKQPFTH